MDLLTPPPKDHVSTEIEEYVNAAYEALTKGIEAVRVVASGGSPDIEAIDRYADVLEAMRRRYFSDGRTITADDVEAARRLADLAREGATMEQLTAAAQRVLAILPPQPHPIPSVEEVERDTLAHLRAQGIELTAEDIAKVRRYAELTAQAYRASEPGVSPELRALAGWLLDRTGTRSPTATFTGPRAREAGRALSVGLEIAHRIILHEEPAPRWVGLLDQTIDALDRTRRGDGVSCSIAFTDADVASVRRLRDAVVPGGQGAEAAAKEVEAAFAVSLCYPCACEEASHGQGH